MIYLGIDVGLTGALAFLKEDGEPLGLETMPIMAKGTPDAKVKNQVNGAGLKALLKPRLAQDAIFAFVERVQPFKDQGLASNCSLVHSMGVIEGVLSALDIPHVMVKPEQWKRHFQLPKISSKLKDRAKKRKELATAFATRLYPRMRFNDDNQAEALLIARYGLELSEKVHRSAESETIARLA